MFILFIFAGPTFEERYQNLLHPYVTWKFLKFQVHVPLNVGLNVLIGGMLILDACVSVIIYINLYLCVLS